MKSKVERVPDSGRLKSLMLEKQQCENYLTVYNALGDRSNVAEYYRYRRDLCSQEIASILSTNIKGVER